MSLTKAEQIAQAVAAESEKPRIGKVVFYGVCDFCGHKIDISDQLSFDNKTRLIDNYGIEKIDDKWVCKHEMVLSNCPFCRKTPF